MNFFIIILSCIFCFSVSCKHKQRPRSICTYNIDSLVTQYDTSRFSIKKFVAYDDTSMFSFKGIEEQGVVSFIEPRSKKGEAGIYTFDKFINSIFCSYSFYITLS